MRSLFDLRTQLLGVRVSAGNHTLWNLGATIDERARVALNDAVASFKFRVTEMYTSGVIGPTSNVVVLPMEADRIVNVYAVGYSGMRPNPIAHFRHVPTAMTNLLYVDDVVDVVAGVAGTRALEIAYEGRLKEFPQDLTLAAVLASDEIGAIEVTGGTPKARWRGSGLVEVTPISGTDGQEIVRYALALPTGFTGLTRGVGGVQGQWPAGSRLSPVFDGPIEAIPTIMASAQASMYEFWVSHQTLYDQFISAAGMQALKVEDLLGLIRSDEDRADRRYEKIRRAPAPGRVQTRRRPR